MVTCSPTVVSIGRRFFYILNLGIPVFLAYTGVMGLITLESYSATSTATVFQAIYMILFATLLFVFEAIQICPCESVDNVIKRNFGFFYGVFGKGTDLKHYCWNTILDKAFFTKWWRVLHDVISLKFLLHFITIAHQPSTLWWSEYLLTAWILLANWPLHALSS